jgi:8-oxo-dGTP pyrophosphatase MutT (NUDIX family)
MNMPGSSPEKPERRWLTRLVHTIFRFTRPMTLGVRGIVLTEDDRVFLVRHTYTPGWQLPGGGVEADESLEQALAKELSEEGNIVMTGRPTLVGVYFNRHVSRRDHVAVYLVRAFSQSAPRPPDREIAECGFFPLSALPEATTKGTRARIAEALEGREKPTDW